jgi:hypothetical protein
MKEFKNGEEAEKISGRRVKKTLFIPTVHLRVANIYQTTRVGEYYK